MLSKCRAAQRPEKPVAQPLTQLQSQREVKDGPVASTAAFQVTPASGSSTPMFARHNGELFTAAMSLGGRGEKGQILER